MRLYPLAVAASFIALYAGPARAGTVSIAPASSAITLGDKVTLTVSLNSADPMPPPPTSPTVDSLLVTEIKLAASGPSSVTVANFQLASDLPGMSSFLKEDPATGTVVVVFGPNLFSSFDGEVYSYDFTPAATGTYTFALVGAGVEYNSGARDEITSAPPATITVKPGGTAAVPEPASLTLLGLGTAGLLGYGRRRK